jgi:signal peptidase I
MAPDIPAGTILVQEPFPVEPAVGDVVLVREPKRQVTLFALRVAALPGSRVEFRDQVMLVDGTRPVHARVPLIGPSFPWPGLEPDLTMQGAYRVPKDSYFLLADNSDDALDSRSFGVVPRPLIVGRVHRWSDLASEKGVARSYLERNIAALLPRLPLKVQENLVLTTISIDQDNQITLSARLDIKYEGPFPLPKETLKSLAEELTVSYCQSSIGRYATGTSAKFILSDPTRNLASIPVATCQGQ